MKEFLINYIEEILFFIALISFLIGAFFINISTGFFVTGLVLIVANYKISKIKKSLAERRWMNENRGL